MSDQILDDPTLANPYGESESKYGWDEEFQRHIVALLLCDRQFLLQGIDIVKPSYFSNKAHVVSTEIAIEFFHKYRILPRKDYLSQEIKTKLKDDKSLPYYLAEINMIYDYFQPGLEAREYLTDKICYFAKMQAVKKAFNESLALLGKNPESDKTWNEIYNKMREVMTTQQNFEIGVDYFKTVKDRYDAMGDENAKLDTFILGLPGIDQEIAGGGYSRGEIISIVAGSGVGKSVMLANIAATNLLRGKKGVYISLELAENKIADRMDAILTGYPVQSLFGHKEDIFNKLQSLSGLAPCEGEIWPLIIKQFPAGTAGVNTVRAYISQLRFHGLDPDFAIVDYVGEMQDDPTVKTYESRERTVRELRAMASEENIFVATAMQPNRDSKSDVKNKGDRSRIDDNHLADAFGQIRPLDGCLSLNQNDNEKLLGIGRGYVIKQRDGKSRYQIYLKFDKENLRITEITQNEYLAILNAHKDFATDDIQIDQISAKGWKSAEESEESK